jgi:hypothetical protein
MRELRVGKGLRVLAKLIIFINYMCIGGLRDQGTLEGGSDVGDGKEEVVY